MDTSSRAAKSVTIDYQKSKIYKIVNSINDNEYIGSTTQTLSQRYSCHKRRAKGDDKHSTAKLYVAMREHGVDKFRIELIEDYPCVDKSALQKREYILTNERPKNNLYNAMFNGKPEADVTARQIATRAKNPLTDYKNSRFIRGCLSHEKHESRYRFRWHVDGVLKTKSFSYCQKRTPQSAYVACDDFRNQTFPLRFIDIIHELPFADQ